MAATQNAAPGMVDPAIFEQLQANIDDDARVREELRNILQKLERQAGGRPPGSLPTIEEVGSTLGGMSYQFTILDIGLKRAMQFQQTSKIKISSTSQPRNIFTR
ncbi:MAG: hypothetical protein Q9216_005435 [Gyalolechia sp. 2 TL-2023]